MERTEPSLVPEWLRSTGSASAGGNSVHHVANVSSSDGSSLVYNTRNKNYKSSGDFDLSRVTCMERTSSSNSRRSSSNGSSKHAYTNFYRSHHENDREWDRERVSFRDHWGGDRSTNLSGSAVSGWNEKDKSRQSSLTFSRKQFEVLCRANVENVKNSSSIHTNGNCSFSVGHINNIIPKTQFEKDFPSLGSEERHGMPDVGRVSSPKFGMAVQSLHSGSSTIGGEGWTSSLAEVPAVSGNCDVSSLHGVHTALSSSNVPSAMTSLNMAEALAQAPARMQSIPHLSIPTQRLEELAIKQSKQLIPVTPSMPRSLVPNLSEKLKSKTVSRPAELSMITKGFQPSVYLAGNHSLIGGHTKSDAPKSSPGKLLVLKPGWEMASSCPYKDACSPTISSHKTHSGHLMASPSPALPKRHNQAKYTLEENKSTGLKLASGLILEKRSTSSLTQSRNDFFNDLKKKTSTTTTIATSALVLMDSSSVKKPCDEHAVHASICPEAVDNASKMSSNGGIWEEVQGFSEEEAAFLRSLGWEENSGEDEGLTEEEINSFYQECMKLKPSLKVCRGVQQRLLESGGSSGQ